MIIRIVASRSKLSIKSLILWIMQFAASTGLFFLIMFVGYQTDGFGIKYLEPKFSGSEYTISISGRKYAYNEDDDNYYFTTEYYLNDEANNDQLEKVLEVFNGYKDISFKHYRTFGEAVKNRTGRMDDGLATLYLIVSDYSNKDRYEIDLYINEEDLDGLKDKLLEIGGFSYNSDNGWNDDSWLYYSDYDY